MFRTKRDLELKTQDIRGSPFFNLRDSIVLILEKHIKEPTVSVELLLFVGWSNHQKEFCVCDMRGLFSGGLYLS